MARIDGTQAQHWRTSPVGVFLDAAFYQVVDATNTANSLRARGIPCQLHRLSGPGLPIWTLKLLPLPEGQDAYPFQQEELPSDLHPGLGPSADKFNLHPKSVVWDDPDTQKAWEALDAEE